MRRRTVPFVATLIAALALSGCGQRQTKLHTSALTPLRVDVIRPNAGEASIYAAQKTGSFRLAGLNVKLHQVVDSATGIEDVAHGAADLAVASPPDLLEARDHGNRVQSVAALVQQPLASLIALSAGTPVTVGTRGLDYQAAYAHTALKGAHVKIVDVSSDPVKALTSKKVAALVGAYSNAEGVQLQAQGKKPRVTAVDRLGVPRFDELVLVANQDRVTREIDTLRGFIGALARSTHELRLGKPGPVSGWTGAAGVPKAQALAALKLTLPLTFPAVGRPFGFQQPAKWSGFANWMRSERLLKGTSAGAFTNRALSGEGL